MRGVLKTLLIAVAVMASTGCAARFSDNLYAYQPVKSRYAQYQEAVVLISTPTASGSGFFLNSSGFIATNAHVVEDNHVVEIKLFSGEKMDGVVVDTDVNADLALVKITAKKTKIIPLSDTTTVGNDVIAVGAPKGYEWSVSKGIVSAVRKDNGIQYIQTEAAINPGNSGGPLIDIETQKIIGINSVSLRGIGIQGINFAISVDQIAKSFPYLAIAGEKHE